MNTLAVHRMREGEWDLSNARIKSLKFLMTTVAVKKCSMQQRAVVNEVEVNSRLYFLIIHLMRLGVHELCISFYFYSLNFSKEMEAEVSIN